MKNQPQKAQDREALSDREKFTQTFPDNPEGQANPVGDRGTGAQSGFGSDQDFMRGNDPAANAKKQEEWEKEQSGKASSRSDKRKDDCNEN